MNTPCISSQACRNQEPLLYCMRIAQGVSKRNTFALIEVPEKHRPARINCTVKRLAWFRSRKKIYCLSLMTKLLNVLRNYMRVYKGRIYHPLFFVYLQMPETLKKYTNHSNLSLRLRIVSTQARYPVLFSLLHPLWSLVIRISLIFMWATLLSEWYLNRMSNDPVIAPSIFTGF